LNTQVTRTAGHSAVLLAIAIAVGLSGCMSGGDGSGGKHGKQGSGQKRDEMASVADEIKAAQEQAIAAAQGGKPGAPISWTEKKSGLSGTILYDPTVALTYSCRMFKQTLVLNGENITGSLTACPQGDGRWKLAPHPG
jgi:surface antigen